MAECSSEIGFNVPENLKSEISVQYNEPMSRHTSFRIGGPASVFITPCNENALISVLGFLKNNGKKFFVLGRGSNVLFPDKGYDGVVINTSMIDQIILKDESITAGSGVSLTSLARFAGHEGLTGLEFAYGIPGSVGGAVFMNAGAYGGEMADVVYETRAFDAVSETFRTVKREDHGFGYRKSVFKETKDIVLTTTINLSLGDREEIEAKMADFMDRRRSKQPLEFPSAGSVFKRCDGHYTGQMIEEAGLKGFSVGGAQVSEKHAGFIINRGDATANDVLRLIEIIKDRIKTVFGLDLECEIITVE